MTQGRDVHYVVLGLLPQGISEHHVARCSPSSPPKPACSAPRTDSNVFSFPTLLKYPELLTRSQELVPVQQFI